jgi:hypothetical protein
MLGRISLLGQANVGMRLGNIAERCRTLAGDNIPGKSSNNIKRPEGAREKVKHCLANQEQPHQKKTFQEEYVKFLKSSGIEYDERYLW